MVDIVDRTTMDEGRGEVVVSDEVELGKGD